MGKVIHKSKSALFFIFPPQFLLLMLLYVIWYGGNVALIGYVVYKIVHSVTIAFS